ncbi:MAG: KpsF/GutQ family sugar-phosphate isomerase [Syntrophobacterales bacterium]|nr:KpsF/GutQ family sugar-phosphate isomerase [Syntrophobacterales bacterium]
MAQEEKSAVEAVPAAEAARWLAIAKEVLEAEAKAILQVAERLTDSLARAVALILAHPGKVVVSGIGKSGAIAHKIAATLASTGTPAVFLHAAEAVHGDLGIYTPGDPSLLISKSGATAELLRLIPVLRRFRSPLIALVGNLKSPLARQADVVLDARVEREADTLNLAPTCSTTAALALGDALAVALMHARNFTQDDFARYHPAGQLGRNLWLTVADVMHRGEAVAWVGPETPLRQVIIAMTERPLGAACVVDDAGHLLGLITDGDLRRALVTRQDIRGVRAREIMTTRPTTVTPGASLKEAAQLMEDRPSQISVLPVVEPKSRRCLGLVRIHDIYQPELI